MDQSHIKNQEHRQWVVLFIYVSMMVTSLIMAIKFNHLGRSFVITISNIWLRIDWVLDDYIKVVKKRNLGLTSKQKLVGQLVIAIAFF